VLMATGAASAADQEMEVPLRFSTGKRQLDAAAEVGEGNDEQERASKGRKTEEEGNQDRRLLKSVAMLLLTITREVSELMSAVFLRRELPADGGWASALIKTGRDYDNESKRLRKEKQGGNE
ncbi:unnamed protein product, partial [Prorocentrum cordatum]